MKIGVLTFWHGNGNYGMMLQCWAMQQRLKLMGHDPFVIRFYTIRPKGLPRWILEKIGLYNFCLRMTNYEEYERNLKNLKHDKLRNFDGFRRENLTFSPCIYHNIKEIRNNPPEADYYIVGSDQVWSKILSNDDNHAYFLEFGEKGTKRIAYAPSFGISKYPKEHFGKLKKALSFIDYLSCREASGVQICKEAGFDAQKVLDPTFLLEKQSYIDLASKCRPISSRPYIFIYSLNIENSEDIRFKDLKDYAVQNGYDIVVTPGDGYCQGEEIFGSDVIYSYSTVEQWLANIAYASIVVTPSFHGIALSLILNKQFVYTPLYGIHSSSNDRITGLLDDLALNKRVLSTKSIYSIICNDMIDFDKVNHQIYSLARESLQFLEKSLTQ